MNRYQLADRKPSNLIFECFVALMKFTGSVLPKFSKFVLKGLFTVSVSVSVNAPNSA